MVVARAQEALRRLIHGPLHPGSGRARVARAVPRPGAERARLRRHRGDAAARARRSRHRPGHRPRAPALQARAPPPISLSLSLSRSYDGRFYRPGLDTNNSRSPPARCG